MDGASPTAQTLLSDIFGYDRFRPMQEDIVNAVAQGEDLPDAHPCTSAQVATSLEAIIAAVPASKRR